MHIYTLYNSTECNNDINNNALLLCLYYVMFLSSYFYLSDSSEQSSFNVCLYINYNLIF